MSFDLMLEVELDSAEQGREIEALSAAHKTWPVKYAAPRRRWRKQLGPNLYLPETDDDGLALLGDDAMWGEPAWAFDPAAAGFFAEAILLLGERLPQGFALRATWHGDPVRAEVALPAVDLAALARRSLLNQYTRYSVPQHP